MFYCIPCNAAVGGNSRQTSSQAEHFLVSLLVVMGHPNRSLLSVLVQGLEAGAIFRDNADYA